MLAGQAGLITFLPLPHASRVVWVLQLYEPEGLAMHYQAKAVLGEYEVNSATSLSFSVGPYTVTLSVFRGLTAGGGVIIAPRCRLGVVGRFINTDIVRREFAGSYLFEDGHNTIELLVSVESSMIEC